MPSKSISATSFQDLRVTTRSTFLSDECFDSEHRGDVDDRATDFHVIASYLGAGADNLPAVHE
jgi:hypothetical protein